MLLLELANASELAVVLLATGSSGSSSLASAYTTTVRAGESTMMDCDRPQKAASGSSAGHAGMTHCIQDAAVLFVQKYVVHYMRMRSAALLVERLPIIGES